MPPPRPTLLPLCALILWIPLGCAGLRGPGKPETPAAPSQEPVAPELPFDRIAALLEAGDPEGALRELDAALAGRPPGEPARLLRGQLLAAAGRSEEARTELRGLLADDPRSVDALLALALLEGTAGNVEAQRDLYRQVLALDPASPDAHSALGSLALEAGDPEAAAAAFDRALEEDPDRFEALYGLGRIALEREEFAEAASYLERASLSEPGYAFLWVDLARARGSLGDHAAAAAALDRAVALEPESYWHRIDRGRERLRLRRWEEARQDFERAVQIDPENFLAYVYRAGLSDQQGRIPEAIADYETSLRLNPEYTFAHGSLGVLYYLQEQWEEAAEALRRAHVLEPREPAYALLAGASLRRAGRGSEATRYLNSLLPRLPRESWEYDIARYLADPAREPQVIAETERERNSTDRRRRLFYIGCEMLAGGRLRTALAYLSETARLEARDLPERRIAACLLTRYGVEEE